MSYQQARDEIYEIIKKTWEQSSEQILGYIPEIRWVGVQKREAIKSNKYYLIAQLQIINSRQSTFRNFNSKKRFSTEGIVSIQIYCPKTSTTSMENGIKLGIALRNSFINNGKYAWFRNQTMSEVEYGKSFYIFNITINFEYSEII